MRQEKREAGRAACEVPVRIQTAQGDVTGVVTDLSRVGARLQIPGRQLGVHRLSGLVQVARRVDATIGQVFGADLHYELLGSALRKTMHAVRIGQRDWESPDVDLGCKLTEVLTDEESALLGLELPPLTGRSLHQTDDYLLFGEDGEDPRDAVLGHPEPHRLRTTIHPEPNKHAPPIQTHTRGLTEEGAVLHVPDIGQLGIGDVKRDLLSIVIALGEAYGANTSLEIAEDDRSLWSGPIRIDEVEWPASGQGNELLLMVAFGRTLEDADRERLGLN